jgi:hypothetical protein
MSLTTARRFDPAPHAAALSAKNPVTFIDFAAT